MVPPLLCREPYGETPDGAKVELFTLANPSGMVVRIISLGATIVSIDVPDRHGAVRMVLGYRGLDGYVADTRHFGATIGRYANRIAGGRFTLDGVHYQLDRNNPPNALHGGPRGFGKVAWGGEALPDATAVILRHRSQDGDQGYPGNLDVTVSYALSTDNVLTIDYTASTDQPTIVNLTNHTSTSPAKAPAISIATSSPSRPMPSRRWMQR
jgi:aldose 1-epimerase